MKKTFCNFLILNLIYFLTCSTTLAENVFNVKKKFSVNNATPEASLVELMKIYGIHLELKGRLPQIIISTQLANATVDQVLYNILTNSGVKNSVIIKDTRNSTYTVMLAKRNFSNIGETHINNFSNLNQKKYTTGPLTREQKQILIADADTENLDENSTQKLSFEQIEELNNEYVTSGQVNSTNSGALSPEQVRLLMDETNKEESILAGNALTENQVQALKNHLIEEPANQILTPDQVEQLKIKYQNERSDIVQ